MSKGETDIFWSKNKNSMELRFVILKHWMLHYQATTILLGQIILMTDWKHQQRRDHKNKLLKIEESKMHANLHLHFYTRVHDYTRKNVQI